MTTAIESGAMKKLLLPLSVLVLLAACGGSGGEGPKTSSPQDDYRCAIITSQVPTTPAKIGQAWTYQVVADSNPPGVFKYFNFQPNPGIVGFTINDTTGLFTYTPPSGTPVGPLFLGKIAVHAPFCSKYQDVNVVVEN